MKSSHMTRSANHLAPLFFSGRTSVASGGISIEELQKHNTKVPFPGGIP